MDITEVMISEQVIQITTWLEEQKCANRILLSSATQHPVPDEQQARYVAGKMVVNQLCRAPPPPLRDMVQGTPMSARPPSSGRAPPRRGAVQPAQRKRSNSAGRRTGGGGGGESPSWPRQLQADPAASLLQPDSIRIARRDSSSVSLKNFSLGLSVLPDQSFAAAL